MPEPFDWDGEDEEEDDLDEPGAVFTEEDYDFDDPMLYDNFGDW